MNTIQEISTAAGDIVNQMIDARDDQQYLEALERMEKLLQQTQTARFQLLTAEKGMKLRRRRA